MNLRYLFKRTLPLALPALLSWGCTGDFERLNTNPYEVNPDDLPFEAQFLEPMRYSHPDQQNLFQYWTNLHIDLFGGYFGSPNGNFPSQRYNLDRGHCGGMHENFMLHIVNNTGRIIKQCDASGKADVAAMMRVVQTYNLLNYTDAYGPVPFTSVFATAGDAFQPSSFAYDSQQEVYARMLEDLDSALEGFAAGQTNLTATNDIWCGGDQTLWTRVANQLKLRIALRMVKVDPATAKQTASEAIAGGVLESEDVLISKGLENEMWLMFNWGDCGAGASLVTMLKGLEDPRLGLYFTRNTQPIVRSGAKPLQETDDEGKLVDKRNANGFLVYADADYLTLEEDGQTVLLREGTAYLGIPPGCNIGGKPNMYSNYSGWAGTFTMPQPILFAAEGWFLRAEAKLRWPELPDQSVQTLYETGVRTSIRNQYAYRKSYAEQGYAEFKQSLPDDWATLADDATIDAYLAGETTQAPYVDPATPDYNREPVNTLCVKWDEGASDQDKLARIITQKWIANFPLSTEAWADYRRTGFPALFAIGQNDSGGLISTAEGPRRLIYNETELNANTAACQRGVELLVGESSGAAQVAGDNGGTRLWWDRADVPAI